MTLRELHNQLTDLIAAGYADAECVVGNWRGGKSVTLVERRNAAWDGTVGGYIYANRNYPGCLSQVIRISAKPK